MAVSLVEFCVSIVNEHLHEEVDMIELNRDEIEKQLRNGSDPRTILGHKVTGDSELGWSEVVEGFKALGVVWATWKMLPEIRGALSDVTLADAVVVARWRLALTEAGIPSQLAETIAKAHWKELRLIDENALLR